MASITLSGGFSVEILTGVLLQMQVLRVGQVNESCIGVNTRELNRELCTGLSTFYTKTPWFVFYCCSNHSSLKDK